MIDKVRLRDQAAAMGVTVTPEAAEKLDVYAVRLVETNRQVNLTAITDPEGILVKHFLDSLSLAPFLTNGTAEPISLVDVGTGAGFPGVPLAIVCPALRLTLLDSLQKRLTFLEALCGELGIPAALVHARAEEAGRRPDLRERFDIGTARAVAGLPVLCEYLLPLVKPGGRMIAMKGPDGETELKAAARFEAPSNDENGVIRIIRERMGLPFQPECREIAFGSEEYEAELALRDEVLRRPIGRSIADDDLSGEGDFRHIGAFDGNYLVGCMVLRPDAKAVRMAQVAVREEYRSCGIGRAMAGFAEACAREMGASVILLHARKTALGFYEKMGFEETGGEFQELGIPHYPMRKDL